MDIPVILLSICITLSAWLIWVVSKTEKQIHLRPSDFPIIEAFVLRNREDGFVVGLQNWGRDAVRIGTVRIGTFTPEGLILTKSDEDVAVSLGLYSELVDIGKTIEINVDPELASNSNSNANLGEKYLLPHIDLNITRIVGRIALNGKWLIFAIRWKNTIERSINDEEFTRFLLTCKKAVTNKVWLIEVGYPTIKSGQFSVEWKPEWYWVNGSNTSFTPQQTQELKNSLPKWASRVDTPL